MFPEIKLSLACVDDAEALRKLYLEMLEELYPDNALALENYKEQYSLERIQNLGGESNGSYWVAKKAVELVGFGLGQVRAGVAYVNWLGVKRTFRNQGIAGTVLNQMISDFTMRGCHKIELYTAKRNVPAQTFYKKRGFNEVVHLDNHYYHLDIILMTKDIAH